jgi:hypothetical protein
MVRAARPRRFASFCRRSVGSVPPISAKIPDIRAIHEFFCHEICAMSLRRDTITKPIFLWARGVLPAMSDTQELGEQRAAS